MYINKHRYVDILGKYKKLWIYIYMYIYIYIYVHLLYHNGWKFCKYINQRLYRGTLISSRLIYAR